MPVGKLSAQAGHAYTDALSNSDPTLFKEYNKGGSKVTLKAKNEQQLLVAYYQVMDLGIPCAIVVDRTHILPPHFDGSPIITALGIGPCTKDEVKSITKKFNCV